MYARVAVSDPLPVFRRGVLACLAEEAYEAQSHEDLLRWAGAEERRIVLLTLDEPADWNLLADLCHASADVIVLVLLTDPSVPAYLRALTVGAAGVLRRDASPAALREAFEAALSGRAVLPLPVVRALAAPGSAPDPAAAPPGPTVQEVEWLGRLAAGETVGRLADRAGYSERMMFRLLRQLYAKLGADNRTEALIRARDRGWV